MNKYKLSVAGIKANEGINRFSNNAEKYEYYLKQFPEDKNYGKLLAAMEEGDAQAAFQAAHAMKGIVGNLSIVGVEEIVKPLVENLRAGDLDSAKEKLPELTASYEKVIAALKEM